MDWEKDHQFDPDHGIDLLPNGRTRQEYYHAAFSDRDIEYWGLDQPGAPGPGAAGFVILDMLDNDWNGESD